MKAYVLTEEQLVNIFNAIRNAVTVEYDIRDEYGNYVDSDLEWNGESSASIGNVIEEEQPTKLQFKPQIAVNALEYQLKAIKRKYLCYKRKGEDYSWYATLYNVIDDNIKYLCQATGVGRTTKEGHI